MEQLGTVFFFRFFFWCCFLRRSGPGATLKGANFLDFMVPSDALRAQDILGSEARPSDSSLAISPGRQIMARAFHTRCLVKVEDGGLGEAWNGGCHM